MKKQIILGFGLLLCTAMQMEAQKSVADQYLHFSVGVGDHNLSYNLQNGDQKGRAGYSLNAAYSYFFTPQWGVQAGVGLQSFGALSTLNFQSAEPATDSDGDSYVFRDAYKNWQEKQKVLLFEIPVEAQFRHPLNKKVQLQASLGGKVSFPLKTSYKTVGGEMVTTGYYSQWDAELSDLPQHGFSTYTGSYNGRLLLHPAYTAIADLGGLYNLTDKLDLYIGAYFNYGLNNLLKSSDQFIYQSDGVYNGVLGSNQTSTIRPVAFGLKVGLYWKMEQKKGKISSGVVAQSHINIAVKEENQTTKVSTKTTHLSVDQPIGAAQPTVSEAELNKIPDVSSNISEVKSNENNVSEDKLENQKVVVETSNAEPGLQGKTDTSISNTSIDKSNENNVSVNRPENQNVVVETSNAKQNFKKRHKASHFITLRFEFNDNNSLDNESDKIETLAETLKANPDLHLLIINNIHNIASRTIESKRVLLMKDKLVELGVSLVQLRTDNNGSDNQFVNASKKKKFRSRR
jgi:OmpA-OmpF porin, OOP family